MKHTLDWLLLVMALHLIATGLWGGLIVYQQHQIMQALRGEVPVLVPRLNWGSGGDRNTDGGHGEETPVAPEQQGETE